MTAVPQNDGTGPNVCSISGSYSPQLTISCRGDDSTLPCTSDPSGRQVSLQTLILTRGGCGAIILNSTEEGLVDSLGEGTTRVSGLNFTIDSTPSNITVFGLLMNARPLGQFPTCFFFFQPGTAALTETPVTVPSQPNLQMISTPAYFTSSNSYICDLPDIVVSQDVWVQFSYSAVYDPTTIVPPFSGVTYRLIATAPVMTAAVFSNTCGEVFISFDKPVTPTVPLVQGPCSDILSAYPPGVCTYTFPDSQTIAISSATISLGETLTLVPGLFESLNEEYTLLSSGSITVGPGVSPVVPLILLQAPQNIGPCLNFTVDVSGTQNTGGRPLSSVQYSLTSITGQNQTNFDLINSLIEGFDGSLFVTIPGEVFSSNQRYNFQVTVVNFCAGSATTPFSVFRYAGDLPVVSLPPVTVSTRNSPLSISASIQNPCPESSPIANMTWTSGIPSLDALLPPLDGHSSFVFIPPFLLNLTTPYEFTLNIRFSDPYFADTIVSQSTSVVLVIQTPTVTLVGGSSQLVQKGTFVNLALVISDPDYPAGFLTAANILSFYSLAWSCVDRDTGGTCGFSNGVALPTLFSASLNTSFIASSRLAISVQATKLVSNTTVTASQQVKIIPQPVPPVVCIVTDPNPATNSLTFAIVCTISGFAFPLNSSVLFPHILLQLTFTLSLIDRISNPSGCIANITSINNYEDYIGVPPVFTLLPMNTPLNILPLV